VGRIRTPEDVAQAFEAGAHIITIPTKILRLMPFNKRRGNEKRIRQGAAGVLAMHGGGASVKVAPGQRRSARK